MSGVVPGDYSCCTRLGFYCYSPSIKPFWIGCLCYVGFGVLMAIICAIVFNDKNRGVAVHSAIIATVCLWMMWACTWLSQWHPLIYPQYTPEEYENGVSFNGSYADCEDSYSVDTIYWLGDGSTTSIVR